MEWSAVTQLTAWIGLRALLLREGRQAWKQRPYPVDSTSMMYRTGETNPYRWKPGPWLPQGREEWDWERLDGFLGWWQCSVYWLRCKQLSKLIKLHSWYLCFLVHVVIASESGWEGWVRVQWEWQNGQRMETGKHLVCYGAGRQVWLLFKVWGGRADSG